MLRALAACPELRPQRLQLRREDPVGPEQRLDAHRRRDVGELDQRREVGDREREHAEHAVGAVDEREAFLLGELDGREARRGERLGGRHLHAAGVVDLALAHDRERACRQGREVARAAERPVLGDAGRDAGVEQVDVRLRGRKPDAGAPARERGQAQQHERADDLGLDARAGAGGVRADERALQLGALGRLDVLGRQRAEAGAHAVDRASRARQLVRCACARRFDGREPTPPTARRARRCARPRRRLPGPADRC